MITRLAAILAGIALAACNRDTPKPPDPDPEVIRVAVIGGMVETGFWAELTARYHAVSNNRIQMVATGNKPIVVAAYRKGGVDLITVHASDAMINLVADGLAVDPQPWARNDLVIVGPDDDPAKLRGMHDARAALAQLSAAHAKLLVHASMGADGVLHDLVEGSAIKFAPDTLEMFTGDDPHEILARAKERHAYTIVGRIPFVSGKLHEDGIALMVQGDPMLRRPYLVETSPTATPAARELVAFLRSPETQTWIATFGVGKYDREPLFYPLR